MAALIAPPGPCTRPVVHAPAPARSAAPGRHPRCRSRTAAQSAEASGTAQAQGAQPPVVQRSYQGLWYNSQAQAAYDVSADIESDLLKVGLGLDDIEQAESHRDSEAGKRAELQWLPRGTEAGSVRDSRGVPSFDLLSLDFEALFEEVVELLTDAHHAELDRLDKRYFVDRVYDRAQILERCRRIYEMEPLDERAAYQEALDLLMSFQQLNENHFTVTNMVAARAEEREAQMGDLVRAGPIQSLPDATDLAIADIALYLEYERELLLQSVKEKHLMAQAQEAAQRAREEAEREAHVAMAETALRERLSIQDIALAGVRVEHVREAVKRLKDEPLPLDYAQMLRNAAIITTELQQ